MASRIASAGVFARATHRYWLSVFPRFRSELRYWQARARAIENPVLRHLALDAQHAKLRSLEGAVAFAAFVPRSKQRPVITALAAYQVIFDYIDTLAEQPNPDPIKNGRQLNQALLAALEPNSVRFEYYAHHCHHNDNGYLEALIDTCRSALVSLPSYATNLELAHRAAERSVSYQSLNHGDASRSHRAFTAWAQKETKPSTGLHWWETGAAAGSSLAVLALIGAMADPELRSQDAEVLDNAYYPWIGALHTLLDSLVDHHEDITAPGHRSLIDYYTSPIETAARLEMIATTAVRHVAALPQPANHAAILTAMASFYLSDPQASKPSAHQSKQRVLAAMGGLTAPTMLVMRIRHSANLLSGRKSRI